MRNWTNKLYKEDEVGPVEWNPIFFNEWCPIIPYELALFYDEKNVCYKNLHMSIWIYGEIDKSCVRDVLSF